MFSRVLNLNFSGFCIYGFQFWVRLLSGDCSCTLVDSTGRVAGELGPATTYSCADSWFACTPGEVRVPRSFPFASTMHSWATIVLYPAASSHGAHCNQQLRRIGYACRWPKTPNCEVIGLQIGGGALPTHLPSEPLPMLPAAPCMGAVGMTGTSHHRQEEPTQVPCRAF